MRVPRPYLLYIGSVAEPLAAKTARGIATWRPELAAGQWRRGRDAVDVGLPDMTPQVARAAGVRTMVLGTAPAGGAMDAHMVDAALEALGAGLHVASGLHQRLRAHEAIRVAAERAGLRLFDVREPPADLPVGTGERRAGKRLLTFGTDCAVGKMVTALAIERELSARRVPCAFRATGQTGILIAGAGVPVDAVVADFLAGAVEMLSPARDDGGWDLIEGQGSLFHPAFAGVSLGLLHGAQPDALVLCHELGRSHVRHASGFALPGLAACLARNLEGARLTNPDVVAVGVSLNSSRLNAEAAQAARARIEDELGLPCQDPMRDGVGRIAEHLLELFPPGPETSP